VVLCASLTPHMNAHQSSSLPQDRTERVPMARRKEKKKGGNVCMCDVVAEFGVVTFQLLLLPAYFFLAAHPAF